MTKTIRTLILITLLVLSLAATACTKKVGNYCAVISHDGTTDFLNVGEGIDRDTVFELGSNGKTVAAYTVLAMADEGVLDLDMKIKPYLDKSLVTNDPRIEDITLRELLCHTAGFSPSYELGVDKKIYFDPGTDFCYSGVGYIYMQNVIENVSGLTMQQAASRYVFEPLGMTSSTFESKGTIAPYMKLSSVVLYSMLIFTVAFALIFGVICLCVKIKKIRRYEYKKAYIAASIAAAVINLVFLLFFFVTKVVVFFLVICALTAGLMALLRKKKLFYACVPVVVVVLFAVGFASQSSIKVTGDLIPRKANCAYSLKSTATDMSKFCEELMRIAKDPEDPMYEMFVPAVEIDASNSWGLGIAIETSADQRTTYWHSGINPGFQSLFIIDPDEERYIVVVTNSDDGLAMAQEMARAFLDGQWTWEIKR